MTNMDMMIKLALEIPGVSLCVASAKSIEDLSLMISREHMMEFFALALPYMSTKAQGEYLSNCWTMIDNISVNGYLSRSRLVKIFKDAGPKNVMKKDDLNFYKNLPEKVEVYRGISSTASTLKGLSWTLNPKTARWFADKFGEKGRVFKAIIKKEYVLAYYNSRNEQEVVVDFRRLQDIELQNR